MSATATATDKSLRDHLVYLLTEEGAHVQFDKAVNGLRANLRGKRPEGAPHSPWEILEHLRIAQWDILEFTRDPKHVSPEFAAGYWPKTQAPPDDEAWDKSVAAFRADLRAMVDLIQDKKTDLLAPLPHDKERPCCAKHSCWQTTMLITWDTWSW
jgi:Mn-containing catalase